MANCNECKNLKLIMEKEGLDNFVNHMCTKHNVSIRYIAKKVKGFLWPCGECDGKDFIKK